MVKFPHLVQAALLFDDENPLDMAALAQSFMSSEASNGIDYTTAIDTNPGIYYRLYGTNQVMVTLEHVPGKAQAPLFEAALSSYFTAMTTPDARERIARHRSHVLVSVHHGVIPPIPEFTKVMQELELPQAGNSLPEYKQRLAVCSQIAQQANRMGEPSLIHWHVTNHLLPGNAFAWLVDQPAPSLLHFHPLVYDGGRRADGEQLGGLMTGGAANFIGHEIHLLPSLVQLPDVLNVVTTFLTLAAMDKGYVSPELGEFGPDDNAYKYRVRHVPEGGKSGEFDGPLYELKLLHWGGVANAPPDDIAPQRNFDDRAVPPRIQKPLAARQPCIAMEWRASRMMAEAAAATSEARAHMPMPAATRPAGRSLFGWLLGR